jgi:hypothetical protein
MTSWSCRAVSCPQLLLLLLLHAIEQQVCNRTAFKDMRPTLFLHCEVL